MLGLAESQAGWGDAAQMKHLPVQVSQEEVKRRKQREAGEAGSARVSAL